MTSTTSAASLLAAAALSSSPHSFRTGIERTFVCSDGIKLAAKHWTYNSNIDADDSQRGKVMCLHGWLDNCASFHLLAPSLVNHSKEQRLASEVVALDFPGHGLSSHKSADNPTALLAEYCYYVSEAAEQLQWDKFSLVGHSMGAGVSVIMAAAFPDKIQSLVLLEGIGPLSRDVKGSAKYVRQSIQKRLISNKTLYNEDTNSLRGSRVYSDISKAVEARMQTAQRSPGNQYISKETAQLLVERAVTPVKTKDCRTTSVTFRHDPRLMWPSLQYNTQEQVNVFWENINCPATLIEAIDGWPLSSSMREAADQRLKLTSRIKLPGSHHHHADPDTAVGVIEHVQRFLRDYL